jgi:hypothetical protein
MASAVNTPQGENSRRGRGMAGRNIVKTHCPQGHLYDEANTYTPPSGGRYCRACINERGRRTRALKRASMPIRFSPMTTKSRGA